MINKRTMSKDYLIKLMNLTTDREFKEIIIKLSGSFRRGIENEKD